MSFQAFSRLVDGAQALSLDVFDTALLRAVGEPTDVFHLVARQYRYLEGDRTRPFDFVFHRRQAERRARDRAWQSERRGEIDLDEIYRTIELPFDWDRDRLKELELEAERALSRPNPFIHALYRHALARGRRVIFTSDMYLPPAFIGRLLSEAGYDRGEALYVSSAEDGLTKHSGALYPRVLARLGIEAGGLLHVGDNPFSDVVMALRHGVAACLYERCGARADRTRWRHPGADPASAVYRGLVHGRLDPDRDAEDRLGFWYRLGVADCALAWIAFGGQAADIAVALGSDGFAEDVAGLLDSASGDPRALDVQRGVRDFSADFERVRASFPWLKPARAPALRPLARLRARPSAVETAHLAGLKPRRAARERRHTLSRA